MGAGCSGQMGAELLQVGLAGSKCSRFAWEFANFHVKQLQVLHAQDRLSGSIISAAFGAGPGTLIMGSAQSQSVV